VPKPDPFKPQPARRESGARSIRGSKLAEDLTATPAAHTLDGHTGSLTKSRLNSTTLVEDGSGVPTYAAEQNTQYRDIDTDKVYINTDGVTTWAEIGTGAAATTFLGLTDTPASYAGETGKVAAVNAGETALEFIAAGGGVTDHGALTGLTDDDHTQYQKESEKDAASGYAGLTAGTKLNLAQMQEVMAHADLTDAPADAHHVAYVAADHAALGDSSPHHAAATASGAHSVLAQDILAAAASATLAAHVELATIAETDTGTDAVRVVTPDGLAGSNYGERVIGILVSDPGGDALTTGDTKAMVRIPSSMTGFSLVEANACVTTVSSSGAVTIQVAKSSRSSATARAASVDMLTTPITIDVSEFDSLDAAGEAVKSDGSEDVVTGDQIRIDVDAAGTGVKGLFVELIFRLP